MQANKAALRPSAQPGAKGEILSKRKQVGGGIHICPYINNQSSNRARFLK